MSSSANRGSVVDSFGLAQGRKTAVSDVDTAAAICFIADFNAAVRPNLLVKLPLATESL